MRLLARADDYAGSDVVRVTVERINSEERNIVGDDAIHVVAAINDADGDTVAMTANDKPRSAASAVFAVGLRRMVADRSDAADRRYRHAGGTGSAPPPDVPTVATPVINIFLPLPVFIELQSRLAPEGTNGGEASSFQVAVSNLSRVQEALGGSGLPDSAERPTGALGVGGSGHVRFCSATAATFGWSFTVEEILQVLGIVPGNSELSRRKPFRRLRRPN